MKELFLAFMLSLSIYAHDGGHGPAIKDESLNGGKVTAVIAAGDVNKGRAAELLYKGELVFESRKTPVKLYIYDKNMKPLNLKEFSKEISAVQIERNSEKTFKLTLDETGKFYKGERPKNKRVPFNIDVKFTKGKQKLFGAFDGLD